MNQAPESVVSEDARCCRQTFLTGYVGLFRIAAFTTRLIYMGSCAGIKASAGRTQRLWTEEQIETSDVRQIHLRLSARGIVSWLSRWRGFIAQ